MHCLTFPVLVFSQVDRLKAELMYERRTSEEHLSHFEDERRVWQEEKEKVNWKEGRIQSLQILLKKTANKLKSKSV